MHLALCDFSDLRAFAITESMKKCAEGAAN